MLLRDALASSVLGGLILIFISSNMGRVVRLMCPLPVVPVMI